jgi:hypothetical protein
MQFPAVFLLLLQSIKLASLCSSDAQSLTKKLSSSGKFSTVSVTPEEEAKWTSNMMMDPNHVHGVFLDHDCEMNKKVLKLVSSIRQLIYKVRWELFSCKDRILF